VTDERSLEEPLRVLRCLGRGRPGLIADFVTPRGVANSASMPTLSPCPRLASRTRSASCRSFHCTVMPSSAASLVEDAAMEGRCGLECLFRHSLLAHEDFSPMAPLAHQPRRGWRRRATALSTNATNSSLFHRSWSLHSPQDSHIDCWVRLPRRGHASRGPRSQRRRSWEQYSRAVVADDRSSSRLACWNACSKLKVWPRADPRDRQSTPLLREANARSTSGSLTSDARRFVLSEGPSVACAEDISPGPYAAAVTGTSPSCCIRPKVSGKAQVSAMRSPSKRKKWAPVIDAVLPVAGIPMISPSLVPL
jgi:hypothetical protein